ncbi:MAG: methyltransferase domain-containing protein [Candidatus Baltobacteraceae bacterium]
MAEALAHALAARPEPARVLIVGIGSGRNVPPLAAGGAFVDAVEEDAERAVAAARRFAATPRVRIVRTHYTGPYPFASSYDAALATHALLHGTRASVAAALAAVRNGLRPGALLFLTLGSSADPRCGTGRCIEPGVWAALDGPEAGVPHLYLAEAEARELLAAFEIRSLREAGAAESAGRWAHTEDEAARLVHWFIEARKP